MNSVFKISLAALVAFLIATQIWHAFCFPLWTDDAFFGTVAKNLANGLGYSSSDSHWNYYFDTRITSGPVIILPAALLVKIFGNQSWVLGITITSLIWILLLTIFVNFRDDKKFLASFIALFLALLFSINSANYGIYNGDHFSLWYLMLGEIPAILLTTLGAMILFSEESRKKMIFGGLILGLAILCKTLAGIGCTMILLVNALKIFFNRQQNLRERIILPILATLGFITPKLIFELTQIIILGWNYYFELHTQNPLQYGAIALSPDAQPARKIHEVLKVFGFSLIILGPSAVLLLAKSSRKNSYYWVALALFLAFVSHALWWIFCSIFINYRYLIASIFYCVFAISFLLCTTNLAPKKLAILIFILVASRYDSIDYLFAHAFAFDEKHDEQIAIAREVVELQQQGVSIFSCGINFELEYLLPGSNNFEDCRNLPPKSAGKKIMLVSNFVNPDKILMEGGTATEIKPLPEKIKTRCSHEYLASKTYLLSWCD